MPYTSAKPSHKPKTNHPLSDRYIGQLGSLLKTVYQAPNIDIAIQQTLQQLGNMLQVSQGIIALSALPNKGLDDNHKKESTLYNYKPGSGTPAPETSPFNKATNHTSIALLANEKSLGVLSLYKDTTQATAPSAWSAEELAFIKTVAEHLSLAIAKEQKIQSEIQKRKNTEAEIKNRNSHFASLTHELRAPLNTIITCSTMGLEGMIGELSEKQIEYLTFINQNGSHLLSIINDLLDMAKIDAGKFNLNLQHIHLKDLLNEIQTLFSPQLSKKEQTLSLTINPNVPQTYIGDPLRIKQVIINLLCNAHKFSPPKSEIKITCAFSEPHTNKSNPHCTDPLPRDITQTKTPPEPTAHINTLIIRVSDSGEGIAPEQRTKIFEPFEQLQLAPTENTEDNPTSPLDNPANHTQTHAKEGTGLGLSIAKKMVEQHHGTIDVESPLGGGSEFSIRLPYNTLANTLANTLPNTLASNNEEKALLSRTNTQTPQKALEHYNALPSLRCTRRPSTHHS